MISKLMKPAVLIVALTSLLSAEHFSGKQGDFWTGGSFNFLSMWEGSGRSQSILVLSPQARFFPANNFCLGPKLSWTGLFSEGASQNMFGVGVDLGYGGGASAFGYILTSPHFVFVNASYSGYFGDNNSSSQAFFLPFTGGVIIPVGTSLGIQIEGGYSIGFDMTSGNDSKPINAITIGIGICGLGEKTAVSLVNVFNLMTSAF